MQRDEETPPNIVLREYEIGSVKRLSRAGGTAGRTWCVVASTGEYLLRMRGARTSGLSHLEFDHGLRAHVISKGVPTTEAVPTVQGARWVLHAGRVYELYPFVTGRPFDPCSAKELVRAAQALALFHRAARDYEPPAGWDQVVAQYTSLGFSDRVSQRMDDPDLQLVSQHGVRKLAETLEQTALVERCIERVRILQQAYGQAVYDRVTGYIIHGDYTPANVLYSALGELVGIFDFDWSMRGPRCLDVAYGLCFFAAEPR